MAFRICPVSARKTARSRQDGYAICQSLGNRREVSETCGEPAGPGGTDIYNKKSEWNQEEEEARRNALRALAPNKTRGLTRHFRISGSIN